MKRQREGSTLALDRPYYVEDYKVFNLDSSSYNRRFRLVAKRCELEITQDVKQLLDFLKERSSAVLRDVVAEYVKKKSINSHMIEKTLQTLYHKGLISHELNTNQAEDSLTHRNKMQMFWLRIPLINTQKHNSPFEFFTFFFKKPWKYIFFVLIGCTVGVFWLISSGLIWQNAYTYNYSSEYLYLTLYLGFMVIFHEIGHISAAKYFNSPTGYIGVGVYYYMPVAYADVHETWNLKRHQRMVVSIAGVYFQIIASLPLFIVFYFTRSEILYDFLILLHLLILNNFNPFIKKDGYWFISDVLGIPNLRTKTFEFIRLFFSVKKKWAEKRHRIFQAYPPVISVSVILYTVLSLIFMTFFIFIIFSNTYKIVIGFDGTVIQKIMTLYQEGIQPYNMKILNQLLRNLFFLIITVRLLWRFTGWLVKKLSSNKVQNH